MARRRDIRARHVGGAGGVAVKHVADIAIIVLAAFGIGVVGAMVIAYAPEKAVEASVAPHTGEAVRTLDERLRDAENAVQDAREYLARERE